MPSKKIDNIVYVKQETMILVSALMLLIGFLIGVVFATYKIVYSEKPSKPVCSHADASKQADAEQPPVKKVTKMIEMLEQEAQRHPEDLNLWIQLGNSCFDNDMHQKAIYAYEKSLEIDPNNSNVLTDLGVMYRRMKEPQKAIQAFEKAVKISPTHEVPRFNKGIVLMYDLNDADGAIKVWEELIEIIPQAKAPNGQLVSEFLETFKKH